MEEIVEAVTALFRNFFKREEDRIEKLPQSGSDRIYFRIYEVNLSLFMMLILICKFSFFKQ